MTSGAIAAAIFVTVVVGAQAVAGRQSPVVTEQPPPTAIPVQTPGQQSQKNPFDNLVFTPSQIDSRVIVNWNQMRALPQWNVECGIKVIVVNPDIDPKMIVTPPPGAAEPKIRRISPPPCSRGRSEPVPEPVVVEVFKPPVR